MWIGCGYSQSWECFVRNNAGMRKNFQLWIIPRDIKRHNALIAERNALCCLVNNFCDGGIRLKQLLLKQSKQKKGKFIDPS
jgi:hypothetical protein